MVKNNLNLVKIENGKLENIVADCQIKNYEWIVTIKFEFGCK